MKASKRRGKKSVAVKSVSPALAEALVDTLSRRLMVVTDEALAHLVQRKVIGASLRGDCCKPDGGTCCPNRGSVASQSIRTAAGAARRAR